MTLFSSTKRENSNLNCEPELNINNFDILLKLRSATSSSKFLTLHLIITNGYDKFILFLKLVFV